MATYEQVIEALRRADEAGNADDARKLAQMASELRPEGAGGRDHGQLVGLIRAREPQPF